MCLDCGCLEPANRHGSHDHIILKRLQRAADTSGLPIAEAGWNIPRTLAAMLDDPGAPLTDRPTLVWDVDGVLAFTAESLCTALNARFGTTYSPQGQSFFPGTLLVHKLPAEQAGWLEQEMRRAAFVAAISPDWHAMDTMRDSWDAGFSVSVVTEREPALQDATAEWLHDWGAPPVPVTAVGHGNKPGYLAERYGPGNPAVLLDDNPAVEITVARPGIEVWTPERPYTPSVPRDHVRPFASWAVARYRLKLGPQP